jgi:hypothetical protein
MYDAQLWGEVEIAGDTETALKPGGRISVDGPIAFGTKAPLRLLAKLDISALPGTTFDLTNPATFSQSAEGMIGATKGIGRFRTGDQEVTTSILAEWGFATMLDNKVLDRYVRRWGVGLRFDDRSLEGGGGYLSLVYGRNEAAGERGWGQWMLDFSFPLGFTQNAIALGGDLTFSAGPDQGRAQRDVLRLRTAVSLPGLVKAIRK